LLLDTEQQTGIVPPVDLVSGTLATDGRCPQLRSVITMLDSGVSSACTTLFNPRGLELSENRRLGRFDLGSRLPIPTQASDRKGGLRRQVSGCSPLGKVLKQPLRLLCRDVFDYRNGPKHLQGLGRRHGSMYPLQQAFHAAPQLQRRVGLHGSLQSL